MSDTRTLTVLAEEAGVLIGELEGSENPVTVLNDRAMADLLLRLRAASSAQDGDLGPVSELLGVVARIVQTYAVTRNKYRGGPSDPVATADVLREAERALAEAKRLFGGNDA
ncbi:MAG: hypothetical protein AB7P08_12535 [Burkholderiales bacterium]